MEASARDTPIRKVEKQKPSSFWWPKTDSIERARKAARRGSVVYGLTAFSLIIMLVVVMFLAEHHFHFVPEYIPLLLLTGLFVYLTWGSYKRPTLLLNSLAFVYMALVVGAGVALMLELDKPEAVQAVVRSLFIPFLALVFALGGLRGSIAVRRFEKQASRVCE